MVNWPPVAAPGWHVYTTSYKWTGLSYRFQTWWGYDVYEKGWPPDNEDLRWGGTSFSAPLAAALALLLHQAVPGPGLGRWRPDGTVSALYAGSVDLHWYDQDPRLPDPNNEHRFFDENLPKRIDYLAAREAAIEYWNSFLPWPRLEGDPSP